MVRLAVCREHLELAIDMYVDECEAAPDVMHIRDAAERFADWTPPGSCSRCGEPPTFIVCSAELEQQPG